MEHIVSELGGAEGIWGWRETVNSPVFLHVAQELSVTDIFGHSDILERISMREFRDQVGLDRMHRF